MKSHRQISASRKYFNEINSGYTFVLRLYSMRFTMPSRFLLLLMLLGSSVLAGCASVPMGSIEDDKAKKGFLPPPQGTAGLYIYRNSNFGGALKKSVYIDGELIGETAPKTYFYKILQAGKHTISTESEFSDNDITLDAIDGKNYYLHQFITMGLFVGGAKLELVSNEVGRNGVLECQLAK